MERVPRDGQGNIVVGFDYPDYVPFMSNAVDAEARKRYYVANMNRGTARNLEIMDEIVALRKEIADLYGVPSYAHYVTKRRMVENPETVARFLDEVKNGVTEAELSDLRQLAEVKAELTGLPIEESSIARWDVVPGFWSTIGARTLKHAAWGDGFDTIKLVEHGSDGAFTAWYGDAEGHSEASRRGWEERGGSRARYRDDDNDRRYSPSRDEEGRFTSSRSRYAYDDDDDRRGSRGHGGWFGDPEGHSEATRRGWEERGGSRSRYRDDDDDRRYSSSRSRDEEGRFTGPRSRYSDDDDGRRGSREHGGWFGDPEGHSEASRRGWEERGGTRTRSRADDDDDRRSSRSRYRDEDDDRQGGRRHGGWYGDPEGHSEAARRGRR